MKLREVRPLMAGAVILYEEAEKKSEYNNIFIGRCQDIPKEMQEREIVVIGVSSGGEMLEIELKKK